MDLYVDEAELEILRRAMDALDEYTNDLNEQVVQETRTFTNTPSYERFLERMGSPAAHARRRRAARPDR